MRNMGDEIPGTTLVVNWEPDGISKAGLEAVSNLDWQCTDAEFVKFTRMCLGLPIDGPAPFGTLLETLKRLVP